MAGGGVLFVCLLAAMCSVSYGKARVAIIGAGIGGTSCAHRLKMLRGDEVELVVYEKGKVGGRLTSVEVGGQKFEAGGAIIHPRNEYMKNFTQELGLSRFTEDGGHLGVFTGERFHFLSTNTPYFDIPMLLARYGLSLFKINRLVSDLLARFRNIYDIQREGEAFRSVSAMLDKMSGDGLFTTMTQSNAAKYLSEEIGLSGHVLDQLVSGAMRMNYNQDLAGLHAFVASVSLAGVEDGLWAVKSGNSKVCDGLLKLSKAKLVHQAVESVERLDKDGALKYRLTTTNGQSSMFDAVVLSAPLEFAKIAFKSFPSPPPTPPASNYQKTHVTFVKGRPSRQAFALNPFTSGGVFPDAVLTSNNNSIPFTSFGSLQPIGYGKVRGAPVWKIFSRQKISTKLLNELFLEREEVVRTDFMAYPRYSPPEKFQSFVLDDRVFYTNAIERAASAMEMSFISGVNAALLVQQALQEDS